MINILYIGNALRNKNTNPSYMFTLGRLLEDEGYQLHYASHYRNKLLRMLHMLFRVYTRRHKTDKVLIDTYSTQNFYFAWCVARLCQKLTLDYVPILHGGNLPQRINRSAKKSDAIFKNALVNVSPSLYLQNAFQLKGYNNIRYIPNTLAIENYQFQSRKMDSIKLLWVRAFNTIYNPLLAVKVLKILLDAGYQAELCMVGPDSDGTFKEVKALAKELNIEIRFTGKLTKQEWVALSYEYNIFLNTANFDNTPLSVIEAMALGLPVVSTNVGGMPYLINNGIDGLLVEPNNPEMMTRAIECLIIDPEFALKMSENARKKVEQFDWEIVKHQWFEILG